VPIPALCETFVDPRARAAGARRRGHRQRRDPLVAQRHRTRRPQLRHALTARTAGEHPGAPDQAPGASISEAATARPARPWSSLTRPRPPSALFGHLVPLATALRWATVAVGIVIAITGRDPFDAGRAAAATLLITNAIFRTVRPLRIESHTGSDALTLVIDLGVIVTALSISGQWNSPFLLTPVPTMILAGYGWGYRGGFAAAAVTCATVGIVDLVGGTSDNAFNDAVQAGLVLGLAAVIGGFTRKLWLEVAEREQEARDQMTPMVAANDLLLALHGLVQTLPTSLDLGEVVSSTRRRFRELFHYTSATLLVRDPAISQWRVELAEGVRLRPTVTDSELPSLIVAALDAPGARIARDLLVDDGISFAPLARSVLVTPLRARDAVVGLVCIEHIEPNHFDDRDADLLDGLAGPLALAVDNAGWFARLRTLGAEAERARIARDLHDRLAQSLAYVAFELERLAKANDDDDDELDSLHDVVQGVVGELRETLYQLRANVSDTLAFEDAARTYLERFQERTGVAVTFQSRARGHRLPLQVEQELWRIFQEGLTNVEHHSDARRAWVTWMVAGGQAWLEIRDDGRGFEALDVDADRFGLLGMSERADAVGARLTVDSETGRGTRLLVELEVPA